MSADTATVNLGPHIEVRVVLDRSGENAVTRGTYSCRCGWVYEASGKRLVVPQRVKDHARVCSWANPGQVTLEQLMGGAE